MTESSSSRLPSPGAGLLLFGLVLSAHVAIGFLFSRYELSENLLLLVTPTVLFIFTLASIRVFRVDARETLLLRLPARADLVMAFPLAISFVVLSDQLTSLTQEIYPLPEEFEEVWRRLVNVEGPLEWIIKTATIGAGAAISEELLFRGFIQNAFLRGMGRAPAVLWTSFLFMLIHFVPLPSVALAGLVLGVTALATRSILVPICIHFFNNMAALALANLTELDTLGDPVWVPPTILLPALAIFVLTMGFYLRRLPSPEPVAERREPEAPDESPRVALGEEPFSLAEELATVPGGRRRLGWIVVLVAVLVGFTVLLVLFLASLYVVYPEDVQGAVIASIKEDGVDQLAPGARERREDLVAAFDALATLNESGNLDWSQLFDVVAAYARASADGRIDDEEVDAVIGAIRDVIGAVAVPRRL